MGCGASKEALEKYETLKKERDELAFDRDNAVENFNKLQKEFELKEQKNTEQMNLLRFKIEVLVQMLAMEEKKLESSVKRLEALKWVMLTQGFSEHTMSNLLRASKKEGNEDDEKSLLVTSAFDLSGAINRLLAEMKTSKNQIIEAFADNTGKIIPALSREQFIRLLFAATTTITKSDVQVQICIQATSNRLIIIACYSYLL